MINLSDRLPTVSPGNTTVPQEGELSLSQWVQWSQGLPVTAAVNDAIEAQLMAIVHPSALLGIGKGFLSFLNPRSCADEGGCGNALCYACYPE